MTDTEKALLHLEEGTRFSRKELATLMGWKMGQKTLAGVLARMLKAKTIEFDGYKRNAASPSHPCEAYRVGPRIRALRAERGSK